MQHYVSRNCVQTPQLEGVDSKLRVSQMSKVANIVQSTHSCIQFVHQYKGERLWIDFVGFQVLCTSLLQIPR